MVRGRCQRVAGVLLAAGRSHRMGGVDKLFQEVGGVSAVERAFGMFLDSPDVCCVAVVMGGTGAGGVSGVIESASDSAGVNVLYATGGVRRQDSVVSGLRELRRSSCDAEFVAVHDAARPLASAALLESGVEVAAKVGAAVPVLPLADSVKRVENRIVTSTVDRESLHATQTPQVFRMEVLLAAHESVDEDVTDDAEIVELAGGLVGTFPGDPANIKLTTPADLIVANAFLGAVGPRESRSGIGYDVHRLVPPGPLLLGGVEIEFGMHLEGHSDGDVLMHVVAGAILGATKQGDMGSNFPSSDTRLAGLDSSYFVRRSVEIAKRAGWSVEYIDAVVIAAAPRIAPHYGGMVERIAVAAGLTADRVSVKSTSTDGVGGIGSGEGVGAQAVATVARTTVTQ